MSEMSAEEFARLRAQDTGQEVPVDNKPDEKQLAIDAMSAKNFLISRTKETIMVPIAGMDGTKDIEIRARLSKSELKHHKVILDRWNLSRESDEEFIRNEDDEKELAVFLAHITVDESLSSEFWLSDEIAPEIADDILMAYFVIEPTRRLSQQYSFLADRLRSGVRSDVASVAPNTV